jgi:hypothetical protein
MYLPKSGILLKYAPTLSNHKSNIATLSLSISNVSPSGLIIPKSSKAWPGLYIGKQ